MKAAARTLARRYSKPDRLYCSAAVRAHQTAQILADAFGKAPLRETALLNPGATPAAFRRLLADAPARAGSIAVVGHEPDLSDFISLLVADGRLRLKLKKGSCVEVELAGRDRGILRALADPSLLGGKA